MPGPAEPLGQAGQKVEQLEQECALLSRDLSAQRAAVDVLRARLDLLARGTFPPGTWPLLGILLAALFVSGVVGSLIWTRARSITPAAPPPATSVGPLPRLLITSEPSEAEVVLDGAPRGRTPLLLSMPGRAAEHRVTVSAPDHLQQTSSARIQPGGGAHVHFKLRRSEAAPAR